MQCSKCSSTHPTVASNDAINAQAVVSWLRPKQESKEILDFVITLPNKTKIRVDPPDRNATLTIQFMDGQVESIKYVQSQQEISQAEGKNEDKKTRQIKILFLSADPRDISTRLRLDKEIREIKKILRQTKFRDKFDIEQEEAVRVAELQGHLLRHKPDIVHFSGHGSSYSEIILEDDSGNSQAVPVDSLTLLFSVLKDNIRCVVLNACYSEKQAQGIANSIDSVIGMSKAIRDSHAISFAVAFYQALGFGRDVKTAFDLGRLQINLKNLNEEDTPKLLARRPEEIVFV